MYINWFKIYLRNTSKAYLANWECKLLKVAFMQSGTNEWKSVLFL